MNYFERGGYIEFHVDDDFDLEKIFECGQCFRWNRDEDGSYTGVARGKAARIYKEGDSVFISGTAEDFERVWYDYFDLGRNYAEIRRSLCVDDYMEKASDFGAGIRILNQDKWEGLCSFIISQCNNIPRIKKIVETLCQNFGDAIPFDRRTCYAFPPAERIARLTPFDLAPLRCGYRAPYIISAAKALESGKLDFDKLAELDAESARRALKSLDGVGDKVANCVVLFALHKLDALPIDVWMKKAIAEHYGGKLDPAVFGEYAGIAQQYMFFYQRSGMEKAALDTAAVLV